MAHRHIVWISNKKIYNIIIVVATLFLVTVVLLILLSSVVSGLFSRLIVAESAWRYMLKQNFPALEVIDDISGRNSNGKLLWEKIIWRLTDIEISNPETYLQFEIAALRNMPGPRWQTINYPFQEIPGHFSDEEKVLSEPRRMNYVVPYAVENKSGNSKILIYHNHTTESFVPTSNKRFTSNLDLTVAKLGNELKNILRDEYGIPVLHNQTIHDVPRAKAYQEGKVTLKKLLGKNPDIELIIDLHRDGVSRELTTAEWEGEKIGKLLFVVGMGYPQWKSNHELAMRLHQQVESLFPGISRGVREKAFTYNQDLHPRVLLIEVGGHENSLEEVMKTIPLLAEAIAQIYNSLP